MIDSGFDLNIGEATGKAALKERTNVLEKFRAMLCSEQPAKKPKIHLYMKPILEIGDVLAFQLQTPDKDYQPGGRQKSELNEAFSFLPW